MNRPIYQVEVSTDGTHKVTVTIEDPGGIDAALAWAKATHAKLIRPEAPSFNEAPTGKPGEPDGLEPPVCQVHSSPMQRMEGRRGAFWSCHQKNSDGSWCNYRPHEAAAA